LVLNFADAGLIKSVLGITDWVVRKADEKILTSVGWHKRSLSLILDQSPFMAYWFYTSGGHNQESCSRCHWRL